MKNSKHFLLRAEASLLCALVILFAMSVAGFCKGCENVRDNVLRLHVIANSDSAADQCVKLAVRDAVLESGADIFDGSITADSAKAAIMPRTESLESVANSVISARNLGYTAHVTVGREYFATRTYGDVTLPAGEYTAVKVILGNGEGKNWWCVMFPPLCLPAVQGDVSVDAYLSDAGTSVVKSNPEYEIRFKAVEVYEKLRAKIKGE